MSCPVLSPFEIYLKICKFYRALPFVLLEEVISPAICRSSVLEVSRTFSQFAKRNIANKLPDILISHTISHLATVWEEVPWSFYCRPARFPIEGYDIRQCVAAIWYRILFVWIWNFVWRVHTVRQAKSITYLFDPMKPFSPISLLPSVFLNYESFQNQQNRICRIS